MCPLLPVRSVANKHGCIYWIFHCVFSNISSNVRDKANLHCLHMFHLYPLCFLNMSTHCLHEKMQSYSACISLTFFQCVLSMSPQIACHRRCKVTLVTFVWIFSNLLYCIASLVANFPLHLSMIVFSWLCIHVSFDNSVASLNILNKWYKKKKKFSRKHLQMFLQIACLKWRSVALVSLVSLAQAMKLRKLRFA